MRTVITSKKATSLLSFSLIASWLRNLEIVQNKVAKVDYPYVLILGEKDILVDNASARIWH